MAIPTPTVIEQWDRRGGSVGDDGLVTKLRGVTVNFGDITGCTSGEIQTLEAAAVTAAGINRWSAHPADASCTCRSMSIRPDGGPHVWQIDYVYSNAPLAAREGDGSSATDPAAAEIGTPAQTRAPIISIAKRTKQLVLDVDRNGDPVVNSAGDAFDPPVEWERTDLTYSFKFWRLPGDLDWSARSAFMDCVNSETLMIFGKSHVAGTLRCSSVIPTMVWETGAGGTLTLMIEINVDWEYDPDGWNKDVLDQGRRERFQEGADPAEMRIITDDMGQPVADPAPLNGAGRKLTGDEIAAEDYHYLPFVRYTIVDLTGVFT